MPDVIKFLTCFVAGVDLLLTPTVLGDAPWYSEFPLCDMVHDPPSPSQNNVVYLYC